MTDKAKAAGSRAAQKVRPSLPLGPFALHARVARGGMGEIWRGVHKGQGMRVAIKVITAARARRAETQVAFRNEIRAIAGLDHPGVVMVFDHGQIPPETEEASGGALVTGSPYMVMEYASRGSMSRIKEPLRWQDLRLVLLSLLEALAHAHARGIIHRDLKPGNVLIAGDDDARPGLKLTDFGIAHVIDSHTRADSRELTMGTPMYMAPEQLRGLWRDYGPWTDLYALGCMVYKLAMGRYPFEADNFGDLCRLHLDAEPPLFKPHFPMPEGIVEWLERLMAKNPDERFQRAADAAFALESFEGKATRPKSRTMEVKLSDLDEESDTLQDLAAATVMFRDPGSLSILPEDPTTMEFDRKIKRDMPPVPESWQRDEKATNIQLLGVGLGLYGLRIVPLVDRDTERNKLWGALHKAHKSGSAQMMLLTGSAGVGKSRLVEWICERAHEVGGATILEARHSQGGGLGEGLGGMLAMQMRCLGLPHREARLRTEQILHDQGVTDAYEWSALTEIMTPATEDDIARGVPKIHFSRAVERHALIQRHLERLSRQRPLILWMDDVQWGPDSLDFVAHFLKAQVRHPSPVLLLLTARDEALAEAQVAWWALRDLMTLPGTSQLEVSPLAKEDRSRLVKGLLALQGDLAAQVEARSGGNPQFAVHLVGDWVQRGVLGVGEGGFVLAEGERAVLPDDLFEVWSARIHRLLEGQPNESRVALEIAALMGQNVNDAEWARACANAGVPLSRDLIDRLLSMRLAKVAVGGWNFAHGMLRETLERLAQEAGRWKYLHAACADMLAGLYPQGGRRIPERRARHLLGAGLVPPAIEALHEAAEERLAEQEVRVARSLLVRREEALKTLGASESDVRWGQGKVLMARGLIYQDKLNEAFDTAQTVEQASRKWGWHLLPKALRAMGDACRRRGDFEQAADYYREALGAFEDQGDGLNMANALHGLAEVVQRRGQVDLSEDLTTKALKLFRSVNNEPGVAISLKMLGQIAQSRGDLDRCEDLFTQALGIFERIGHKFGTANAYNVLAEVARQRGDLDKAEQGYRQAHAHYASVGATGLIPQLNLGLVLLARDAYKDARETLGQVKAALEERGGGGFLIYVHAALMACAPNAHDWASWDDHMAYLTKALFNNKLLDRDLAWCAHLAGDNAAAAGQRASAGQAYELALEQWKGLGDDDKVAEVSAAWASITV